MNAPMMRRRLLMAMGMEEDENMSWQYLGESTNDMPLQFESGKYKEFIITGYINANLATTQYARVNIDGHVAMHYAIVNVNGEVALTLFVPLLVEGAPIFYFTKNGKQTISNTDRGNALTSILTTDSEVGKVIVITSSSGGEISEYKLQVWAR